MRRCFNLLVLFTIAAGCNLSSTPPTNATDAMSDTRLEATMLEIPTPMDGDGDGASACPMAGFRQCSGVCINTMTDPTNCGGCGTACAMGQVCAAGVCALNCGQLMTCYALPGEDGGVDPDAQAGDGGPRAAPICADIMNDPLRCGRCDRSCMPGEGCRGGVCVPQLCPTGLGMCAVRIEVPGVDGGMPTVRMENRCVDLQSNSDFCGTCETACPPGARCRTGRCEPFCQPGTAMCDRAGCTPLQIDPNNCGECRRICPTGNVCVEGRCQLSCGTLTRCSRTPDAGVDGGVAMPFDYCADTQNDVNNCGMCGRACATHERCENGLCRLRCQPPLADCLGQCVDTRTDNRNCGQCGRGCVAGLTCAMGMDGTSSCIAACMPPAISCPAPNAGSFPYCAILQSDRNNCGRCGNVCPGSQTCVGGACTLQCFAGQTLCGTGAEQVCTITANDPRHCGACNNVCPTGAVCNGGRCEPRCSAPLIGCPATAPTFCVDARFDPSNCGRCGFACEASRTCIGGTCCTAATTPDASFTRCAMGGTGCATSFILRNGQSAAQGFTTGTSGGFLVRARLHMSNPYAFLGRAARLYVVAGTSNLSLLQPSVNVERDAVASTTLLGGVIADWYDAGFSPPVRLDANRNYFLVMKLPDFPVTGCPAPCVLRDAGAETCECPPVRWTLADDTSMPSVDPYMGGFAFSCGVACPIFTQEATRRDHAFEVYLSSSCVTM